MTELQQFLREPGRCISHRELVEHLGFPTDESTLQVNDWLNQQSLSFDLLDSEGAVDEHEKPAKKLVMERLLEAAESNGQTVLYVQLLNTDNGLFLVANDSLSHRYWISLAGMETNEAEIHNALVQFSNHLGKGLLIIPKGEVVKFCRELCWQLRSNDIPTDSDYRLRIGLEIYSHSRADIHAHVDEGLAAVPTDSMTHLDRLEAESIHIIREVIAQADNPVMLYSVGKDSAVMLHLARKAFYPSVPPFPLLHVDTRWKFQAMYDFRDFMAQESGMDLLVHINPEGVEQNINPLDHGSAVHTDIMKTQGLKQALDHYKFDVAFGGARRDEEKSRAKERVFSFRTAAHRWDAKNQRPELWNQYNGRKSPGESVRVFPLSNWTELDIWQYIYREQIPIVPLYFAQERPVVERNGMLMMVDDDRLDVKADEEIQIKKIRFRTLGCYPLTGAIESEADDLASIVLELLSAKTSERQGRAIDSDSSASMEKKKEEGYF